MARRRHPDQRHRDARRRAGELERPLGVGARPREEGGDLRRQAPRQTALEDRGRGESGEPQPARRDERRHRRSVELLGRREERLRQREIHRQLHRREAGLPARRGVARQLGEAREAQPLALVAAAQTVPGGDAVARDRPRRDLPLELGERGAQPVLDRGARHLGELGLGVVEVVEVERREPEVLAAAADLIGQEPRRERVAAGDQLSRLDQPAREISAAHGLARLLVELGVERQVAALGRDEHLVALDQAALDGAGQRPADGALAALVAIVDGAVEDVAARREGGGDRILVVAVARRAGLAEIGAEADRRQPQTQDIAEVPRLDELREALGIAAGSFRRGPSSDHFGRVSTPPAREFRSHAPAAQSGAVTRPVVGKARHVRP